MWGCGERVDIAVVGTMLASMSSWPCSCCRPAPQPLNGGPDLDQGHRTELILLFLSRGRNGCNFSSSAWLRRRPIPAQDLSECTQPSLVQFAPTCELRLLLPAQGVTHCSPPCLGCCLRRPSAQGPVQAAATVPRTVESVGNGTS